MKYQAIPYDGEKRELLPHEEQELAHKICVSVDKRNHLNAISELVDDILKRCDDVLITLKNEIHGILTTAHFSKLSILRIKPYIHCIGCLDECNYTFTLNGVCEGLNLDGLVYFLKLKQTEGVN